MAIYLYDVHTHTCEVSKCGQMPAAEVVRFYAEAGYDGLVVTDHLSRRSFDHMPDATWDEKIDLFMTGYKAASEEAKKHPGFTVLLGCEIRLDIHEDNDYLVYGIDEAFLRNVPNLLQLSFAELSDLIHEHGYLIVQAHPFREDMCVSDWTKLDGVEVFNGNVSHNSNDSIANAWADLHHLIKTSGSDFHGIWGKKTGGLVTQFPVDSNEVLLSTLRQGNYSLLV